MADKQVNIRGKGNPWKPGQSGNPKGRPKKDMSLTSLLKKYLEEVPNVMVDNQPNTRTWRELIVQAWLFGSYRGNATLFKELLERLEGKVAQPLTGGEGEPLIPPLIEYHFADGTVVRPPRNGHEVGAVSIDDDGNGSKPATS